MKCDKAQSMILDSLYGDLPPREQKALLRHLQACPACAEEYEANKATISTFGNLDMEEPPAGLSSKVLALATEEAVRHKPATAWGRQLWKPALATVAAAMLAVVFVINYLPVEKNAHMATWEPVKEDRQTVEKPVMHEQTGVTETEEMAPEYSLSPRSKEKLSISRRLEAGSRGEKDRDTKYMTPKLQLEASDATGTAMSEGRAANIKRRKKAEHAPSAMLFAPAPTTPGKDDTSNAKGMETTVFDALETDSVAISDSEEYKKAGVITDAYSEPAEAHEIHVKKSQKVISEVEYTGKEEAKLGGNGLPATQESALDKAQNEYLDGNAYFKKEDYEQAALKYQMALELATEEKVAAVSAYQLGRSYQELEQFEQAITVYRDLVRKHPDFPGTVDVYLAIGECYLGMGDSENALRSFELVLDEFPDKREIAQEKINQTKAQQEPAEDTEESQPEANTTD